MTGTKGAKGLDFQAELRRRKQAQGKGQNLQRKNEHVQMEEEDLASSRRRAYLRELAFKASVLEEIQQVKAREEAERAERHRLAEIRRGAVLERLRKIEEEQARLAREAAEAETRILEAEALAIQKEANRLAKDHANMQSEDDRAAMCREVWKEEEERLKYIQEQEEKMKKWEEQQRVADLEEEANRTKRAAELEEKKRKLALLREKFPEMHAAPPKHSDDSRLQRIRQKAVYKSKAMTSGGDEADGQQATDCTPAQEAEGPAEPDAELAAFVAKIEAIASENDLRALQNELSAKKRALRIEQRQCSSKEEMAEIRARIAALGKLEEALQARLDAIVGSGGGGGSSLDEAPKAVIDVAAAAEEGQVPSSASAPSVKVPESKPAAVPPLEKQASQPQPRSMMQVFKRAEQVMRDATALATQLQEGKAAGSAADIFLLELTELMGTINSSNDNLAVGYCSRLDLCSQLLKSLKVAPSPAAVHKKAVPVAVVDVTATSMKQPSPVTPQPEKGPAEAEKAVSVEYDMFGEPGEAEAGAEHKGANATQQPTREEEEAEAAEFGEEGDGDVDGEEELDLESIEGWNECVNTSMATAAHHAAYYGYFIVLEVIAKYFDCSVADETGKSPLHYAALSNQLDCVVLLVQYNAAMVDMGDELGDTALHAAASSEEGSSVLEFLLSCECSPDIANYEGKTIAHVCRTRKNLEIVAAAGGMLYCVDTLSRTPLYCAASDGNNECVEYLMQQTPPEYQMWPDEKDGNSPLHIAAIKNNERAVDLICVLLANIEDISVVNKKQYTAAHVAASAAVLTKLYENGADLWIPDAKNRFPLYIQCFFARADNVAFLLNAVANRKNAKELVEAKDLNGDTVLHVASLCGHIKCVTLLLYFLDNSLNSAGITPDGLAQRAGHSRIQQIILHVETQKTQGADSMTIFGSSFENISSCVVYYGSRWTKCYSAEYGSFYFYDRVTGSTTWELPELYDVDPAEEKKTDAARDALISFYSIYNPDKLYDIDKIVEAYKGKYTELFIDLAGRYEVEDLSIFQGVYVED